MYENLKRGHLNEDQMKTMILSLLIVRKVNSLFILHLNCLNYDWWVNVMLRLNIGDILASDPLFNR